jgi:hypothetical protein
MEPRPVRAASRDGGGIRALPERLSGSIRTGVLLPSFAHALAEVVANSIDACATSIDVRVDVAAGGFCVEDDGHGVRDMRLLGERHCTSRQAGCERLGYRGEVRSPARLPGPTCTQLSLPRPPAAPMTGPRALLTPPPSPLQALHALGQLSALQVVSRVAGSFETLSKRVTFGALQHVGPCAAPRSGKGTTVGLGGGGGGGGGGQATRGPLVPLRSQAGTQACSPTPPLLSPQIALGLPAP